MILLAYIIIFSPIFIWTHKLHLQAYWFCYKPQITLNKLFKHSHFTFNILAFKKYMFTKFPVSAIKHPIHQVLSNANIHEAFQHMHRSVSLDKTQIYYFAPPFRGYDALSCKIEGLKPLIEDKDYSKATFYEYKIRSTVTDPLIEKYIKKYNGIFQHENFPDNLQGFRPTGINVVDIGFLTQESFDEAINIYGNNIDEKGLKIKFTNLSYWFENSQVNRDPKHGGLSQCTIINKSEAESKVDMFSEKMIASDSEFSNYIDAELASYPIIDGIAVF